MPGVFSPVAAKSFAALFIPRARQPWGVITGFASLCLSPLLPALTLPVSTSSPSVRTGSHTVGIQLHFESN